MRLGLQRLAQQPVLNLMQGGLAVQTLVLSRRLAGRRSKRRVVVPELPFEPGGEHLTNGRLAGAHHADQRKTLVWDAQSSHTPDRTHLL